MTDERVLDLVRAERARQRAAYGENADLADGTGPGERWLLPVAASDATRLEKDFRRDYDRHEKPTWMRLVREEIAEAFAESDPARLAEELVQVAALCVSWVGKLQDRHGDAWGIEVNGEIVTDPDWDCPADVMRSCHGFDLRGPVALYHRPLGSPEWIRLG